MSKHDLENMIFNLEERKDLKKVEFTQKAVIEILGYLKQLADLEAKLAEMERCAENNKKVALLVSAEHNAKIEKLEHQLAEKDRKIKGLGLYTKNVIDFAVEQLEKVKELAEREIKECNNLLQEECEDDYYIQSVSARQSMCYDFRREINQQIKQLKEMK